MKRPFYRFHVRKLVLWFACAFLTSISTRAGEVESLLNKWLGTQTNLTSWSADFVQTRHLKTLVQPLVTPGKVWFLAPEKFRWELGQPPQSIALRTDTDLLILTPKLKRAERYSLTEFATGPMRDFASLIDTGFPRDAATFKRQFEILGTMTTNGVVTFRLQPRNAKIRKMLPELTIDVAADDYTLKGTSLLFADGSLLRNDFSHVVVNAPADPQLFSASIDGAWKITEPLKSK